MKASLKNYRQSPRKVRLVADLVSKKSAVKAVDLLAFTKKRAAPTIKKLIESAIANAVSTGADKDLLVIKNIMVNKGITLKRYMPVAHGASHPIMKHSSHVEVELGLAKPKVKKTKPASFKKPVTQPKKK